MLRLMFALITVLVVVEIILAYISKVQNKKFDRND